MEKVMLFILEPEIAVCKEDIKKLLKKLLL